MLSEQGHSLLSGDLYIDLIPLLNGQYTEVEIIDKLQDRVPATEIFYALGLLKNNGYTCNTTPSMPFEQVAFWQMLDVEPGLVPTILEKKAISVITIGEIDTAPFKAILNSLGIKVHDNGELLVVITNDYLQNELDTFNQESLKSKRPWMLVKPIGTEIWIGPMFIPGKTGCWACLAHRLMGHRKVENYIEEKKAAAAPFITSLAALPSTLQTAFNITATEIAKWLVCGENKLLEGTIVTLNALSLEKHNHLLVQRPQCHACGNPSYISDRQLVPPALQSTNKYKVSPLLSAEQTFKKLEHHISPITGIVSALRRNYLEDDRHISIPSYIASHTFALPDNSLNSLLESLQPRTGGKGRNDIQAKTSALCESIERYSGVFQGNEARCWNRYQGFDAAIHPNDCMLFSQQQFQNREQWNAKNSSFNQVPEAFDENMEIEWSPVWSLTHNCFRYLPTAYCYYGYARKYNARFARADSNGCAAGNSKAEAILRGLMELVERDSVALWWYNQLKKPAVDLSTFDEPYFQQLQAHYQKHHLDLWVLDLTSDLQIPTFAALACRNDLTGVMFGFGADFDPQAAIISALTELNQLFPTVVSGTFDEQTVDRDVVNWLTTATIENQPYLKPDSTLPLKVKADYPQLGSNDPYTDVMTWVQIAKEKGLETLILDQTRPDTGLDVVKTIVPSLRHFWARLGSGRLYEVPVQMGWLSKPLKEEELNPQPMFR